MIKAIVVDDIKKNRDAIKVATLKYCPNVSVIGEADGVSTGIKLIKETRPNIVFLDVEMQDGTGFDLLKEFPNPDFKIIFITGHEDYAFKAFKYNAFNYLLKPIDKFEFIATVNKLEKQIETENLSQQISLVIDKQKKPDVENKKIVLRTFDKVLSVAVSDIIRCESENAYTTFYFNNGKKLIVSSSLKEFEEKLGSLFFRTHQSHLINLNYFEYYSKADGGSCVLKDGTKIPLASRKKDEFMQVIEKL